MSRPVEQHVDANVEWKNILWPEIESPQSAYLVPANPEEVSFWVTAAVFKTLTSRDLVQAQLGEFMSTPKRGAQIAALSSEDILSGKLAKAFPEETSEAVKEGRAAAKANFIEDTPFHGSSFWNGSATVYVWLTRMHEDPGTLLMIAPIDSIGKRRGFPTLLIERSAQLGWPNVTPYRDMLERFSGFAFGSKEDIDKKIKNHFLYQAFLDRIGVDAIDAALKPLGIKRHLDNYSDFYKRKEELLPVVYKSLSKQDKAKVRVPITDRIVWIPTLTLNSKDQEATLEFMVNVGKHTLAYDPAIGGMNGELNPDEKVSCSVKLKPNITAETTHSGLLSLRKEGIKIVESMGFYAPLKVQ